MNNPGRRFHRAFGLLLAASLGLAACANQTGNWAAPADESAAKVETQSADLQSETWKLDCKKRGNRPPRLHPLDLVIGVPVCVVKGTAAAVLLVGALAALVVILPPVMIADWASKQWPASDTEEKGIPGE